MARLFLSRSKHLLPFAQLLNAAGADAKRLLRRSALPSNCLDNPETLIAGDGVFAFREKSARDLDLPNIALDAMRNIESSDLGEFGTALTSAPTLTRLLTTFRNHLDTQTTITAIELESLPAGHLSFRYRFEHLPKLGVWHSDLYTLLWSIKIVRLVSPNWSPPKIWTASYRSPRHQQLFEQIGINEVDYGSGSTGFVIPASMLALPVVAHQKHPDCVNKRKLHQQTLPQEYDSALRQVMLSYAKDGWLTIEQASEVLGPSVRTIQRRLTENGTSYSLLLEQLKSEMAGDMLENTDIPIAEISRQLGYLGQANFTRAFRRWSGMPPRQFRQLRRRT